MPNQNSCHEFRYKSKKSKENAGNGIDLVLARKKAFTANQININKEKFIFMQQHLSYTLSGINLHEYDKN